MKSRWPQQLLRVYHQFSLCRHARRHRWNAISVCKHTQTRTHTHTRIEIKCISHLQGTTLMKFLLLRGPWIEDSWMNKVTMSQWLCLTLCLFVLPHIYLLGSVCVFLCVMLSAKNNYYKSDSVKRTRTVKKWEKKMYFFGLFVFAFVCGISVWNIKFSFKIYHTLLYGTIATHSWRST